MDNKESLNYRELRIYKPTRAKSGAATKINIKRYYDKRERDRFSIFMESALEIPSEGKNAAFGWDDPTKKVTVLLGDNDIGDFLLVLDGRKSGLGKFNPDKGFPGIYHKVEDAQGNQISNTMIKLDQKINEATGEVSFAFYVSKQKDGNTVRVNHIITDVEAVGIAELMRGYYFLKYCN